MKVLRHTLTPYGVEEMIEITALNVEYHSATTGFVSNVVSVKLSFHTIYRHARIELIILDKMP